MKQAVMMDIVKTDKQFDTAHQNIAKYIIVFSAFLSFMSFLWFGISQTFGFWLNLTSFICALVIGIIPLPYLKDARIVFVATFFGAIWIASKILGLLNSYQYAITRDPSCDLSCITDDPITYSRIFIPIIVLVYLYSPLRELIRRES